MLNTKFRENRPAGSTEENFLKDFTIYGRVMLSDFMHYVIRFSFPCTRKLLYRSAQ